MKVIAFGSPLRGDDGVGLAVLDRLRAHPLPPDVELLEGGTGALALLEVLADQEPGPGRSRCLIIDAVDMGLEPGAVRVLELDTASTEVAAGAAPVFSLHDADLSGALALAQALGWRVRARLLAMQPADLTPHLGLTPAVAASVEEAATAALTEILEERHPATSEAPSPA